MGLGLPLGSLLGALGAILGSRKATREAPRRVRGPFGGPLGLWQGAGLILGVLLGSKKGYFEGSKPLDSIGRANRISIFEVLDTGHENLRFWIISGGAGGSGADHVSGPCGTKPSP